MNSHTLPRLYSETALEEKGEIALAASQAHYLTHVLRLSAGDKFLVFNGKHGEWLAEIVKMSRNGCLAKLIQRCRPQNEPQDLHYYFAPLKQGRLDYMVQKAVELGASLLQPVLTAHTAVSRINLDRVQANAVEAAEQCGILSLPQIKPAIKFASALRNWNERRVLIFCDERAAVASPIEALGGLTGAKLALLIGPEGGFSEEEREVLLSKPFVRAISLGPRIMRADTAAVAGLALVNAVLGDWR